jgi:hypothetical protein
VAPNWRRSTTQATEGTTGIAAGTRFSRPERYPAGQRSWRWVPGATIGRRYARRGTCCLRGLKLGRYTIQAHEGTHGQQRGIALWWPRFSRRTSAARAILGGPTVFWYRAAGATIGRCDAHGGACCLRDAKLGSLYHPGSRRPTRARPGGDRRSTVDAPGAVGRQKPPRHEYHGYHTQTPTSKNRPPLYGLHEKRFLKPNPKVSHNPAMCLV